MIRKHFLRGRKSMFVLNKIGRLAFTSTCVVDQLMPASRSETEAVRKLTAFSCWAISRRIAMADPRQRAHRSRERRREISRLASSNCRPSVSVFSKEKSRWACRLAAVGLLLIDSIRTAMMVFEAATQIFSGRFRRLSCD